MLDHLPYRRIVTLGSPEEMEDYDLDLAVRVMGLFHPSVVWKLYLCHKRWGKCANCGASYADGVSPARCPQCSDG